MPEGPSAWGLLVVGGILALLFGLGGAAAAGAGGLRGRGSGGDRDLVVGGGEPGPVEDTTTEDTTTEEAVITTTETSSVDTSGSDDTVHEPGSVTALATEEETSQPSEGGKTFVTLAPSVRGGRGSVSGGVTVEETGGGEDFDPSSQLREASAVQVTEDRTIVVEETGGGEDFDPTTQIYETTSADGGGRDATEERDQMDTDQKTIQGLPVYQGGVGD